MITKKINKRNVQWKQVNVSPVKGKGKGASKKPLVPVNKSKRVVKPKVSKKSAKTTKKAFIWLAVILCLVALLLVGRFIYAYGVASAASKLEAAPTTTPAITVPTSAPVAATPATKTSTLAQDMSGDQVCKYTGNLDLICVMWEGVRKPGDEFTAVVYFEKAVDSIVLERMAPDDILVSAVLYKPGQANGIDFTKMLDFVKVSKGGTGNQGLDVVLKTRGANIKDGEILKQNKTALQFNAPAGSFIVFKIIDDANLKVNRGVYLEFSNKVDAYTKSIN